MAIRVTLSALWIASTGVCLAPSTSSLAQDVEPEKIEATTYSIGVVVDKFKEGSKAEPLSHLRSKGEAILVEVNGKRFGDTNASSDKRERVKAAKANLELHNLLQKNSADKMVIRIVLGGKLYEVTFDGWDSGLEYEVAPWSEDKSIMGFKNRRGALPTFKEINRISAQELKARLEKEAKDKAERDEKSFKDQAEAEEKARERAKAGVSCEARLLATLPDRVDIESATIIFDPLGYSVAFSVGSVDRMGQEAWSVFQGDKRVVTYQELEGFTFSKDGVMLVSWGTTVEKTSWEGIKDLEVLGPRVAVGDKFIKYRPGGGSGKPICRPVISPDNRTVAFAAADQRTGAFVVVAEKTLEKFASVGDPVFGSDGTLAYIAALGGKWYMVVGEKKSDEFDGLGKPVFSPDGKTVAYQATKTGQRFKKQFVVIGNEKGEPYDEVGPPVFSRDGTTVAYWAKDGAKRVIVWGEKKSDVERGLSVGLIALSADGKRLAYQGHQPNSQYVIAMGGDQEVKKSPRFEVITTMGFGDGGVLVYAATDRNKAFVVAADKQSEGFADVKDLAFSTDRKAVAYCATNGVEWRVIVGDQKGPGFDDVWRPRFSPDGKKVCYGARKGRELWWKVMELN